MERGSDLRGDAVDSELVALKKRTDTGSKDRRAVCEQTAAKEQKSNKQCRTAHANEMKSAEVCIEVTWQSRRSKGPLTAICLQTRADKRGSRRRKCNRHVTRTRNDHNHHHYHHQQYRYQHQSHLCEDINRDNTTERAFPTDSLLSKYTQPSLKQHSHQAAE